MSRRHENATAEGRPLGICVWGERTLPDGTRVAWGIAQWASGQIVGIGWCVVQVDGGAWQAVDFQSGCKLRRTIEACDDREEIRTWVLEGSQWPPYTR